MKIIDDNRADVSVGDVLTAHCAASPVRFDAGDVVLGRYRVIDELGQGGMGVVYRCFDDVGGIEVALKALPPEVSHNSGEMDEVRENFRLVEKLHHPNIAGIKTLERDPTSGNYYLIMECVDGMDLRQWARKRRSDGRMLTFDEVLAVAYYIAAALDYAHEQNIIHRDIKPGNVRVTFSGEVKVLDFGLAAQLHSSMSRVSRTYGATSGTGFYMAPEQWRGWRQDARADQYALAATVYELLAGSPPFDSHNVAVLREAVLNELPQPLFDMTDCVNVALLRGLAKEPDDRFRSCGEFVKVLRGEAVGKFKSVELPSSQHKEDDCVRKNKLTDNKITLKRQKKPVFFAVLAVVVAYGAHRGYHRYREQLENEHLIAVQDKAVQARIVQIKEEAEAALAGGDLAVAGARIVELEMAGGASSIVAELRRIYEGKAGERETNRRYAVASVARENIQKINEDNGFDMKLDALEVVWREAEAARQGGGWGQALSNYDKVLVECSALEELTAARKYAEMQRKKAMNSRREAVDFNAAQVVSEFFDNGEQAMAKAAKSFDNENYKAAGKLWQEAIQSYVGARLQAMIVQAYRKAKSDFDKALCVMETVGNGETMVRIDLLKVYGGSKWSDVQHQQRIGATSSDMSGGEHAYKAALAALPAAVQEAISRQQEVLRKDREKMVADAISAARRFKKSGKWLECMASINEVLALEQWNGEALALKREVERKLVPTLVVRVFDEVGRMIPANIKESGEELCNGEPIELITGRNYKFMVDAPASAIAPRGYHGESLNLCADWYGQKVSRVVLKEVKGPVEGHAWVSPSSGMEFIWIAPLKIWVGKYEVSNGEYRKKEAEHNSRKFKQYSLNGDQQPVVYVNFDDAKAYAAWLTECDKGVLSVLRYRVISEQEWECCARCGDSREYPWGSSLPPKRGNYNGAEGVGSWSKVSGYDDGFPVTCPVDKSGVNEWGLYGIGGNAWEICAADSYGSTFGAWCGGAWCSYHTSNLRCVFRRVGVGSLCDPSCGFRLVMSR